jgi:hypothetical protein
LDPAILCEALGRFPEFLRERGLSLPARPTHGNVDYDGILSACMDGALPSDLDDALFYVRSLGNKEGWEKIQNEAEIQGKALSGGGEGLSCSDLAIKEWLHNWPANRDLLEQTYARGKIQSRTHHVYYPRAVGRKRQFRKPNDSALAEFRKRMSGYFAGERLGGGARVIMYELPHELWFLVRYPGQFERYPAIDEQGGLSSHVFRPEEYDAIVYQLAFGNLRLSTNRMREHAGYLREFGQLLLGDGDGFSLAGEMVQLEALKGDCRGIFNCDDVPGLERVRLIEVKFSALGSPGRRISWVAEGEQTLLEYCNELRPLLPSDTDTVFRAKFHYRLRQRVQFNWVTAHTGKTLEYERGGDAGIVEEWFRRRSILKGALGGCEALET